MRSNCACSVSGQCREPPATTPGPCALCDADCGPEEFCYGCMARVCARCADVAEKVSWAPVGEHLVTDHAGPERVEAEDKVRRLLCRAMWLAEIADHEGRRSAALRWRQRVNAHRDIMHAVAAHPRPPGS